MAGMNKRKIAQGNNSAPATAVNTRNACTLKPPERSEIDTNMIERGPARECDMVIAFLQAEILSSRYAQSILGNLEFNKLSRETLIDRPDLDNEGDNAIRRALLQIYRGYGSNAYLFIGFPQDVGWRFVDLEPHDHGKLSFAREASWIKLSEGTRSVERLARRIARLQERGDTADRVRAIQQDLMDGKVMAPLITVEAEDGRLILVEGHSRATAYVGLNWQRNITILVGSSAMMFKWQYY